MKTRWVVVVVSMCESKNILQNPNISYKQVIVIKNGSNIQTKKIKKLLNLNAVIFSGSSHKIKVN